MEPMATGCSVFFWAAAFLASSQLWTLAPCPRTELTGGLVARGRELRVCPESRLLRSVVWELGKMLQESCK